MSPRPESTQFPYPSPYSDWYLQRRIEGSGRGNIFFWTNQDDPTFIYNLVTRLETIYLDAYIGRNCGNLPANITEVGVNTDYTDCVVDDTEDDISDIPGMGQ